ncbi:MAG: hypothetical protein AAF690_03275 [Acidobacteriota bacterium]
MEFLRRLALPTLLVTTFACAGDEPAAQPTADEAFEVLTTGSKLRGANGLMFGPDGRLYQTSVVTPAVAVIDPETGEFLETWGPEQGARGPDDIAFGPDGSAYWTDISIGEVVRRMPDGEWKVIANLGAGVNPITFSDDGRLFVSQCFMDTGLYELDPDGVDPPRSIRDDLGPGCGLNGMDWGPDDKLYGPRWFRGEVVRVDVDSGEMETVADGFQVPAALKFDSQGRLHVLDSLAGEILRVDTESGDKEVVGRATPGLDNIAFDAEDRLFFASFADGFVAEVLSPEENRILSPGGINMPGGIAYRDGQLFLADFFALRSLDAATGEITRSERDVIGFSELGSSMSVQLAGEGLILTSWFDNAVRLWDPSTRSLLGKFDIELPIDALTIEGDVVVSQWAAGQVVRFSPDAPEEREVLLSDLSGAAGLATQAGALYVTDQVAGTLTKVEGGEATTVATELSGPEGVAVGEDGTVYVVEAEAGRVSAIDGGGNRKTLAEGLELQVPATGAFPKTMLFNGIALGDGVLYVSGDRANSLYTVGLE